MYKALLAFFFAAVYAAANHQVMVEGNCGAPLSGRVAAGTCGDYDGDGRLGVEEDEDGDRVFGTIPAALGSGGVAQNGLVLIVSSGTFTGNIVINATAGNVTLEAAQGITANIDAVLPGDEASVGRQGQVGILIDSGQPRQVIIRNLGIRNWGTGIRVQGNSRASIESARLDNNSNYGIEVRGNARVAVDQSQVIGTGYRVSSAGDFPSGLQPTPGTGIAYFDNASGSVSRGSVVRSWGAGVSSYSSRSIRVRDTHLFDNAPDLEGVAGDAANGRSVY